MTVSDEQLSAILAGSVYSAGGYTPPRVQPPPRQHVGWGEEAYRIVVGGVRDAGQGFADTVDDVARVIDDRVARWGLDRTWMVYGRAAQNGWIEGGLTQKEADAKLAAARAREGDTTQGHTFIHFTEVEDPTTRAGKFGREVVEFAAGYAAAGWALRGMAATGAVARVAKATAASSFAAFIDVDAMDGNLANMAKDLGVPKNVVTDLLAVESDDSQIEARLKNAVADAAFGLPIEGALTAIGKGIRAAKAARVAKNDIKAAAAPALKLDPRMAEEAGKAVDEALAAEVNPKAAPRAADSTAPGSQAELFPDLPRATEPSHLEKVDAMFDAIPSKIKSLDEDGLNALVDGFLHGRDYEVLARLGLNPARIDFSKVLEAGEAGAVKVEEMVMRIADATQDLAAAAGSKPKSWKQTAFTANVLGLGESSAVAAFRKKTANIDGYAWAARQVLAGSAARLTKMVENARPFVNEPTNSQWIEMLRTLETHAALQAQFKGATSQLARGLASLKGTATAKNAMDKAKMLRSVVPDLAVDGVAKTPSAAKTPEEWLQALGDASSPKERQRLLDVLAATRGDLAKIGRMAERLSGPTRFQRAVREFVVGNLFSVGTATANIAGTGLHLGYRALSRLPVHGWAYATGRWQAKEFVATRAADMAFMNALAPALWHGVQRVTHLLGEELTEEAHHLARTINPDSFASEGLGKVRELMDDKFGKLSPRFERTDAARTKEWRISADTVQAWRESVDHGPAFYRAGLRGLIGVASGAFNGVGAASRVVRLATIDVSDELFGTLVQQATMKSEAARLATLEGIGRDLGGDELAKFVDLRAKALLDNSADDYLERVEALVAAGAKEDSKEVMEAAAEAARRLQVDQVSEGEARKVLFQDQLAWEQSKNAARLLGNADFHTGLLFPFIRTPMKILERTLGEYTPLGLLQREMWDKIMSGGPDAAIVVSQMTLGSIGIASAAALASSGVIVGYDGGPKSSSRVLRPSYSINVGGKWVEYNRLDPVGMLLGLGADIHDYSGHEAMVEDEYGLKRWDAIKALTGVMTAISRNALSKTWMGSLRDVADLAASDSDSKLQAAWDKLGTSTIQKLTPAGGMQRWWMNEDANATREAFTAWDKVKASTFAAADLPEKRDSLLGRVIPYDRVLGLKVGGTDDPLLTELGRLAFDLPDNPRSAKGVHLTVQQTTRLNELRGQVVRIGGATLEEALREEVNSSDWAEMPDYARVDEIQKLRGAYQREAVQALEDEDREFARSVETVNLRKSLEKRGLQDDEISAELQRFKKEFF